MKTIQLKKNEDRRLRAGHLWIYSNEVDTAATPLKTFAPGEEAKVIGADKSMLGMAYVNPQSLIAGRLYSRHPNVSLDTDFFQKRILTALALREKLYPAPFYRLVFGESDALPGLIIDRFKNSFVLQLNTAGMERAKDAIISALQALFPSLENLILRNDSSIRIQEGLDTYVTSVIGEAAEKTLLEENGVSFYAPLIKGQKTGWFFDHRLNRTRLKDYVHAHRVLDVFSYLGGWGIQAAAQGAKEVYCVDSSPLSAAWIQENAHLNNVAEKTYVITADAFEALKDMHQQKEKFDVIILDPPAFVKKQKDLKEGLLAYQRLNELALKLLVTDGILLTCSCSMHVSETDFLQALRRASLRAHCEVQILERGHQAQDHPVHPAIPETDYLKMLIARKV